MLQPHWERLDADRDFRADGAKAGQKDKEGEALTKRRAWTAAMPAGIVIFKGDRGSQKCG